jgi:hypothetical protein
MPRVAHVHPNGEREELDVAVGKSLMQGATSHGVDGILAECGANAMCEMLQARRGRRGQRHRLDTHPVACRASVKGMPRLKEAGPPTARLKNSGLGHGR